MARNVKLVLFCGALSAFVFLFWGVPALLSGGSFFGADRVAWFVFPVLLGVGVYYLVKWVTRPSRAGEEDRVDFWECVHNWENSVCKGFLPGKYCIKDWEPIEELGCYLAFVKHALEWKYLFLSFSGGSGFVKDEETLRLQGFRDLNHFIKNRSQIGIGADLERFEESNVSPEVQLAILGRRGLR